MMANERIEAAQALAEVLARENEALQRLDFPAAATLLSMKEAALLRLTQDGPVEPVTDQTPDVAALGARLTSLAAENRQLLEQAITVQTRVLGIILRAAADSVPPVNYAANGQKAAPRRSSAMTLSAQA